ncbi:MAG: glycerophosphodiester phosphodiesterase family protein [Micromonosporaceae bacterium]
MAAGGITVVAAGPVLATPPAAPIYQAGSCGELEHVAHRGAGGLAPENTRAAMALADSNGGDVFEVDVQLSKDGKVVLMHDTNLVRTTNVEAVFPGRETDPINTFTLSELRQLDAGKWFEGRFAGEKIPTLAEVLDYATPNSVGVFLELKDPALNPGLIEAVHAEMSADSRWDALIDANKVTFTSFDAAELKQGKQLRPDIPVVWVSSLPADDATLAEAATWAEYYGTHYRTLGAGDVDRIKSHGLKALLYTLDSPEALQLGIDLGANALITDFPNVLTAVCDGTDPFPDSTGVEITSVVANPAGDDVQPENGEYLVLKNTTGSTVSVSKYYIHDAVANTLKVGTGYSLAPGASLRIYTGPGTNTATRYYNKGTRSVLNNDGDSLAVFTPTHILNDVFAY